eukprot:sb/3469460/
MATFPEEMSLQGYKNHTLSESSQAPMTEAEKELEEVKYQEILVPDWLITTHVTSITSSDLLFTCLGRFLKRYQFSDLCFQVSKNEAVIRSQMSSHSVTLPGLNLPIAQELETNLEKFKKGFVNYLQIKLDTEKEELKLWDCSNIQVGDLSEKIPLDEPRYHLFNFNHDFEGEKIWKVVFLYSCPGDRQKVGSQSHIDCADKNLSSKLSLSFLIYFSDVKCSSADCSFGY